MDRWTEDKKIPHVWMERSLTLLGLLFLLLLPWLGPPWAWLRPLGGMDGRTNGRTDGRMKDPCVLQDSVPFGAAALLHPHLADSCKAGQREPLTTYCPWATG